MAEWNGWETTAKNIDAVTGQMTEFVEKGKTIKKTVWVYVDGDKYWETSKYFPKSQKKKGEGA